MPSGSTALNFGKHRGESFKSVYKGDPNYVKWVTSSGSQFDSYLNQHSNLADFRAYCNRKIDEEKKLKDAEASVKIMVQKVKALVGTVDVPGSSSSSAANGNSAAAALLKSLEKAASGFVDVPGASSFIGSSSSAAANGIGSSASAGNSMRERSRSPRRENTNHGTPSATWNIRLAGYRMSDVKSGDNGNSDTVDAHFPDSMLETAKVGDEVVLKCTPHNVICKVIRVEEGGGEGDLIGGG